MINYGVAYQVTEDGKKYIEINRKLLRYPKLYDMVYDHELEHMEAESISDNFWIDFRDIFNLKKQIMLFGFVLRHPSGWANMAPIFFENKRVSVNWFMSTVWLAILITVIYILKKVY